MQHQSFIAHFRNYHPNRLRFFYRGNAVAGVKWPGFYQLAIRSDKQVVLVLQIK